MEISKGTISSAKKVVLYGPEGIGKSTFASKFPDPVFIDTEGSTKEMDVKRLPAPKVWEDILEEAQYIADHPESCYTVVIDTVDWAETMCIDKLNDEYKTKNVLTLDYGKGSLLVVAEFKKLVTVLDKIVANGINVLVTAHAAMRKQEQPDEMGAYDRWELKLQSKQVKSMVKEWADMVLFANYKTYVIEDDKTKSKKAQGGKRVMYTSHHPCWDAKNRYGLPECIDFNYEEIAPIVAVFKNPASKVQKINQQEKKPKEPELSEKKEQLSPEHMELQELMMRDGISRKRLEFAVATKMLKSGDFSDMQFDDYDPEFIRKNLIEKWEGFKKYAKKFTKEQIEKGIAPFDI